MSRRSWSRRAAVAIAVSAGLAGPAAAGGPDWVGAAFGPLVRGPAFGGAVTTDDLVRLRELGAISLSPDGHWTAFAVRQARPETNSYVVRWFVQSTHGGAPNVLDQDGGQPIPNYAFGFPQASIPPDPGAWAPDSRHFAFRRLIDHRVELWVADRAGEEHRVADGAAQVTAFAWVGETLVFRTGLNYARFEAAVDTEAAHGWLQDGRVAPFASEQRPAPPSCEAASTAPGCEVAVYAATAVGVSPASAQQAAGLEAVLHPSSRVPPDSERRVLLAGDARADGARVWAQAADAAARGAIMPRQQVTTDAAPCSAAACTGGDIRAIGWARGGHTVWFLKGESDHGRRDGAPYDLTALYEWRPATGAVRRVWRGEDLLTDCHAAGDRLVCGYETALRPRRLVSVDLGGGAIRELADPNPQFADKATPRLRKLFSEGLPGATGFAHLVYPLNYDPKRRYPLVIVQYLSKGFLRGGVGNETPILPLSAAGFVVLSTDQPMFWDQLETFTVPQFDQFIYDDDLRDRRSVLRALNGAIDQLVSEGLVDPQRVAITGLSSGAEAVHYALQHSDRFAAAIASSGAHDVTFLPLMPIEDDRSRRSRRMAMFRTTSLVPPPGNALYALAWSQMPQRLTTPLLINGGEREAMLGFEGLESLKAAGRPLEVRVFPDEYHWKYHPQSYVGVYRNSMAWLRFWLQGVELDDPILAPDYARWRAMRIRLQKEATSKGRRLEN